MGTAAAQVQPRALAAVARLPARLRAGALPRLRRRPLGLSRAPPVAQLRRARRRATARLWRERRGSCATPPSCLSCLRTGHSSAPRRWASASATPARRRSRPPLWPSACTRPSSARPTRCSSSVLTRRASASPHRRARSAAARRSTGARTSSRDRQRRGRPRLVGVHAADVGHTAAGRAPPLRALARALGAAAFLELTCREFDVPLRSVPGLCGAAIEHWRLLRAEHEAARQTACARASCMICGGDRIQYCSLSDECAYRYKVGSSAQTSYVRSTTLSNVCCSQHPL